MRMSEHRPTVPDRKPRLTDEEIGVAILWLESNEGDEGETLQKVADWFKTELNHRAVRAATRGTGVGMKDARAAIARTTGEI